MRATLLFDGDCGICTSSAEICRRIDRQQVYRILPFQDLPESELGEVGLTHQLCSKRMYLVSPTGRLFGGAFAVNRFFWGYWPWKIGVALIYLLFPILLLEIPVYWLVARYRYRISGWLGLAACRVPEAPAEDSTAS